jgi:hypothetical protein
MACGVILLKKAISFLIFRQLGVEVFENPKVNLCVHSGVEEYWADDSTARNCAPNSRFSDRGADSDAKCESFRPTSTEYSEHSHCQKDETMSHRS